MSPPPAVGAVFFDLFGTLLSLAPLDRVCDRIAPGRGGEIAERWRARQLEASWLRTSMERWADFDVVTRDAFVVALEELGIEPPPDIDAVAGAFLDLPLADGAADAVRRLREAGAEIGILTNASGRALEHVAARLDLRIDHLLSVDAAQRFKPHPGVYQLAVDATHLETGRIGFVTANGWDAAGAASFGFRVGWLRADPSARLPAVGVEGPMVVTWADLGHRFG
ncbi:MAG TPA: haloacid dehalogenase type II [Candidatus Limnocylindrales bacterium]|nr:haloacid dehalogenase type II [Candidatus Limnocylindrales bacterium]